MGAVVLWLRYNVWVRYLTGLVARSSAITHSHSEVEMSRIYFSVALGVLLIPMLASRAAGQAAAGQQRRVPVTVIFSDRVPSDSRFVVQRVPGAARRDRILLRSGATAEDLMAAINTLLSARQIEGDVPPIERTMRIRPTQAHTYRRTPYAWIARVLTDLRQAPPTDIPGIGRAQAVQVWLPIQAPGGKARPGARSQTPPSHVM